jgi:lipid IVA palmitoyltransferase
MRRLSSLLLLFIACFTGTAALAQTAGESPRDSWWSSSKAKLFDLAENGNLHLMVSGYSYHGRNTYTKQRISELNERAWGLGFMSSKRDANDNEETVFASAFSDSHFDPQLQAGYSRQWMNNLGPVEVGAGYSVMLISRTDYFSGVPFPIALPVASIGSRKHKLMATYVPRLSKNKGNGDVLYIFARFQLD